jgi:glycerol-3-phosphate dehydrogenase
VSAASRAGDDLGSFDLIVIGAGINGCGIARDATLRGLRTLLLDKADVASGTTSWSTRLIHGGLRYLEHGEIGLVRESLRERDRLLRIAPHLVRPLPLLIPLYRDDRRGAMLIRAGMVAYDALSSGKSLPRHRILDRQATLTAFPGLAREGLRGAALYYDCQVEFAERLALENALDARDHGAGLRTYHRVDRLLIEDDRVVGVQGQDLLFDRPFHAAARCVVNVAGPWVDRVLGRSDATIDRLIGGTKGSHIVVGGVAGAPPVALYAESRRNGRPFFVIPWNHAFLIGTTDVRYDGCLDRVRAEDWEIDWLLAETNQVLPEARLTRADVWYSYAGVRPLPWAPGMAEGRVTRRHAIVEHSRRGGPHGLLSIVGGKLTTFRELAEQVVDQVLRESNRAAVPSTTSLIPLPGARSELAWPAFQEAFLRDSRLPRKSAEHLLRVYGTRAQDVVAFASTPAQRTVIDPVSGAIAAEIPWAFQVEGARSLTDALARRSMIGWDPDLGARVAATAAAVARDALDWGLEKLEDEAEAYGNWIRRYRPEALEPRSSEGVV